MNIDRIFLDLDDVLNDFTREALQYVTGAKEFFFDPAWGYDIVKAANSILNAIGHGDGKEITVEEFWDEITRDFWANIKPTEWCQEIINTCVKAVGKENVCILTSPTQDPDCLAGKMEWMQRELPSWLQRQFLVGPCKQFCARPGSLLIDDCEENVKKFREHGGKGWEFPRPWNSRRDEDPQEWIKETGEILKTLAR